MSRLQTVKIADLGRVVTGKTPPTAKSHLYGKGYPFITPTDIGDLRYSNPSRQLSEEGRNSQRNLLLPVRSVCVTCIASVGKICMTDQPSFTNQQINSIIVDESRFDPFFVYYLMRTQVDHLKSIASGAATPIINKTAFSEIEVKVPPLPTQKRIAGILSAYDELIENNQRRIRILEEMARSLYREWFVHFRYPGHEEVPLVDSPLGPIPQGWEIMRVADIAETYRGKSYRSADLADEGGLPFVNLKNIDRDGGFRRSGLKRYSGVFKDSHVVKKGDIVMAVTDMTQDRRIVARAALIPSLDHEFGVISMDLVRVVPKHPVPRTFLYAFLRFSDFADEVKQHANGANVLHLSPDRITAFQFAMPPLNLVLKFTDITSPCLELADVLENKVENLRETRDLLLPKLISGQVDLGAM